MAVSIANTATDNIAISGQASGTTGTISGIAIGAAASDRLVFVCFLSSDLNQGGIIINACTIGGITAANAVQVDDGGGLDNLVIFWALVPTGTTANIVVTFSGTCTGESVIASVFSVTGADTTSPVTASNSATDLFAPSAAVTVPVNGALLACGGETRPGSNPVFNGWTNASAVTQTNQTLSGGATTQLVTATSSSTGSVTVTATWSNAPFSTGLLALVAIQSVSLTALYNPWPQRGPILAQ